MSYIFKTKHDGWIAIGTSGMPDYDTGETRRLCRGGFAEELGRLAKNKTGSSTYYLNIPGALGNVKTGLFTLSTGGSSGYQTINILNRPEIGDSKGFKEKTYSTDIIGLRLITQGIPQTVPNVIKLIRNWLDLSAGSYFSANSKNPDWSYKAMTDKSLKKCFTSTDDEGYKELQAANRKYHYLHDVDAEAEERMRKGVTEYVPSVKPANKDIPSIDSSFLGPVSGDTAQKDGENVKNYNLFGEEYTIYDNSEEEAIVQENIKLVNDAFKKAMNKNDMQTFDSLLLLRGIDSRRISAPVMERLHYFRKLEINRKGGGTYKLRGITTLLDGKESMQDRTTLWDKNQERFTRKDEKYGISLKDSDGNQIYDENGDPKIEWHDKPRQLDIGSTETFGFDIIFDKIEHAKGREECERIVSLPILVLEGPFDMIAADIAGTMERGGKQNEYSRAVWPISLQGCGNHDQFINHMGDLCRKVPDVKFPIILAFDQDEAGLNNSHELRSKLEKEFKDRVDIFEWSGTFQDEKHKRDMNDLLQHAPEAASALIRFTSEIVRDCESPMNIKRVLENILKPEIYKEMLKDKYGDDTNVKPTQKEMVDLIFSKLQDCHISNYDNLTRHILYLEDKYTLFSKVNSALRRKAMGRTELNMILGAAGLEQIPAEGNINEAQLEFLAICGKNGVNHSHFIKMNEMLRKQFTTDLRNKMSATAQKESKGTSAADTKGKGKDDPKLR